MSNPNRTGRRLSRLMVAVWVLILIMFLASAAWSLSGQLYAWGMPTWLARPLSLMFDAAGLICATYARRAIERGTPAGLARLSLLAFVIIAGILNWNHGKDLGGIPAAAGLASLSFGVELLFELHRRDVRDEQRAARGLIAERLPHIPAMGWLMYPGRSWKTLRSAVGTRLDVLDPVQTGHTTPGQDTDKTPDTVPELSAPDTTPFHPGPLTQQDMRDIAQLVYDAIQHHQDNAPDTQDSRSQPVPDSDVTPVRDLIPDKPSITSIIRTSLSAGIRDTDTVLSRVRQTHPDAERDNVRRILNRLNPKAAS